MKVYLHINYFEQGYDLETALQQASDLGVAGVEFRRIPLGSHQKEEDRYLDVLEKAWERWPIPEISFGAPGPNLMVSEASQREAEWESAAAFYREAARRFPVKVINLLLGELINPDKSIPLTRFSQQGAILASDEQADWAVEGCRALAEVGKACGLRFGLETHGIYLHDTVEAACRLAERVDRAEQIGVLWDRANEYLFDDIPELAASHERCRSRLFSVHLKNLLRYPGGGYRICNLSEGEIDLRRQLRLLRDGGYAGPICLECPRPGDRLEFLKEDFLYLESVLSEISGATVCGPCLS